MPLRILCVDDVSDACESLAALLRLHGFEADAACGRPDALAAAKAHPPDVILMDLAMPGHDGYQVAKELLGLCPTKPLLIAVTGHTSPEYRRRSAQEQFDFHTIKPIDPLWLVDLLREYEAGRGRAT